MVKLCKNKQFEITNKFIFKKGGVVQMAQNKDTSIKRYESTAKTYEEKGKRERAYAKNGQGGEHYQSARDAFDRAKRNQDAADKLKKSLSIYVYLRNVYILIQFV